jgi:hypothetical protein
MSTKKEMSSGKDYNSFSKRTNYYRTYEASPIFSFRNSEILTTASQLIDFGQDNADTLKFLPLNACQIINNSSYEIYVYLNQGTIAKSIPSGTIINFDSKSIPALRSVRIYNAGAGTITANQIEFAVWREGVEIDNAFAKLHKALFKYRGTTQNEI